MVNGVMVTEKVSPLWGYKMVAPDGDITHVTLSSGFTIRGLIGNEHGSRKIAEKLKAGFLRFSECPVATGAVPRAEFGQPCEGKFSDEKCCPHLDKIIKDRRDAYRKTSEEYGHKFATQQERLIKLMEQQAAERVAEKPTGGKGRIGG
jgi:hypothetical protein